VLSNVGKHQFSWWKWPNMG